MNKNQKKIIDAALRDFKYLRMVSGDVLADDCPEPKTIKDAIEKQDWICEKAYSESFVKILESIIAEDENHNRFSLTDIRNAYESGMTALVDGNGHGESVDEYINSVHSSVSSPYPSSSSK